MVQKVATPRQQERYEKILRIAQQMFFTQGYAAVSMSAIAARLGGSKGTLYNYFPSKQDLFTAVMGEHFDRVGALMRSLALDSGDTAERLRSFGFKFLDLILSDEYLRLYRLVTAEASRFPEIGAAFQGKGMIAHKQALSDFFQSQMDEGVLRRGDPALAAKQFLDLCRSDLQRLRVWNIIAAPTAAELKAQAAQATEAIMALYAPQK